MACKIIINMAVRILSLKLLFFCNYITAEIIDVPYSCIVNDTTLRCINAQLTSVPLTGGRYEILYMYDNLLTSLSSNSFECYSHAEEIYLQRNEIEDIEESTFYVVPYLKVIDLSYNDLRYIHPDLFIHNLKLKTISLQGNPLVQVNVNAPILNAPFVQNLDISRCAISSLTPRSFSSLKSLQNINIQSNNIQTMSINVLEGLQNLRVVNLGNNHWTCDCNLIKLLNYISSRRPADVSHHPWVHCYMPGSSKRQSIYPGRERKFCQDLNLQAPKVPEQIITDNQATALSPRGRFNEGPVTERLEHKVLKHERARVRKEIYTLLSQYQGALIALVIIAVLATVSMLVSTIIFKHFSRKLRTLSSDLESDIGSTTHTYEPIGDRASWPYG
ncbi:leucine-rich repeat-containing protein 38 [Anabrus simplex]|uniref:leucine-rich repeat-containing protein 38 n=1 Tax=Anabrus simplex TaxID=316456 RepID=UPI0035A3D2E6